MSTVSGAVVVAMVSGSQLAHAGRQLASWCWLGCLRQHVMGALGVGVHVAMRRFSIQLGVFIVHKRTTRADIVGWLLSAFPRASRDACRTPTRTRLPCASMRYPAVRTPRRNDRELGGCFVSGIPVLHQNRIAVHESASTSNGACRVPPFPTETASSRRVRLAHARRLATS